MWTGNDPDQAEIVVEDLETHVRKTVRTGGNDARYLPTGHLVYAFENDLFALQFDLETLSVGEDGPVSVLPGVRRGGRGGVLAYYAISDDGTLVHMPGSGSFQNESLLAFVDRDGMIDMLPAPGKRYDFPGLSPDERRIAVEIEDDDGIRNIWIYDTTSTLLNPLTLDGGQRPLWWPDGNHITYLHEGSLWNIPADFSGPAIELAGTNVAGNDGPGSWSTDDQVLLFSSPAGIHAWTRDRNGGSVEVIVPAGPEVADRVSAPQFSPNGFWFVFVSGLDQEWQLFALPYPVGSARRQPISTDGGLAPIWRSELFFIPSPGSSMQAMDIQTEPTLRRTSSVDGFDSVGDWAGFTAEGIPRYDVTADGARLLGAVAATVDTDTEAVDDYRRVNVILNWFEELKERVPVP